MGGEWLAKSETPTMRGSRREEALFIQHANGRFEPPRVGIYELEPSLRKQLRAEVLLRRRSAWVCVCEPKDAIRVCHVADRGPCGGG